MDSTRLAPPEPQALMARLQAERREREWLQQQLADMRMELKTARESRAAHDTMHLKVIAPHDVTLQDAARFAPGSPVSSSEASSSAVSSAESSPCQSCCSGGGGGGSSPTGSAHSSPEVLELRSKLEKRESEHGNLLASLRVSVVVAAVPVVVVVVVAVVVAVLVVVELVVTEVVAVVVVMVVGYARDLLRVFALAHAHAHTDSRVQTVLSPAVSLCCCCCGIV